MNEPNETLDTLKAIHTEQQKQSKYLQSIYLMHVFLFALGLIAIVVGGIAIATGAIHIRF